MISHFYHHYCHRHKTWTYSNTPDNLCKCPTCQKDRNPHYQQKHITPINKKSKTDEVPGERQLLLTRIQNMDNLI